MCGIFAILNPTSSYDSSTFKIVEEFKKGKNRGPEFSNFTYEIRYNAHFGFHRLAINGLNKHSNQPLVINDIALICNGEIYNYKELYKLLNITPITESDCEVIIHLYTRYGIEQTLQMLDGEFSFILADTKKIYVARDPYGVRPLYILKDTTYLEEVSMFGFASDLRCLSNFNRASLEHFPPGYYQVYKLNETLVDDKTYDRFLDKTWQLEEHVKYHSTGFNSIISADEDLNIIFERILYFIKNAVRKRCFTTERPIACLLSGGLDSSLVTALVNEYHQENNLPQLETYSIGLYGSEDLANAKIVAEYLNTKHTEIILTEKEFIDAIPFVINDIESYDTTTVRASIGNWLLGKYISTHSQAKVIFNGDGSDELAGGYLYMNYAPDSIEFDKECRRLLSDIHKYDGLRSDKSISSHGLEPRTPFLDRSLVQYYLSIHPSIRFHKNSNSMEKYLIRNAFLNYTSFNKKNILPLNILLRRKEAFSDGVSKKTRSLFEIIQEYTSSKDIENINFIHLQPMTSEQKYYRSIFEKSYPGLGNIIPYFWMPKYIKAKDASARTLPNYK